MTGTSPPLDRASAFYIAGMLALLQVQDVLSSRGKANSFLRQITEAGLAQVQYLGATANLTLHSISVWATGDDLQPLDLLRAWSDAAQRRLGAGLLL